MRSFVLRALLLGLFACLLWPAADGLRAETILLKNGQILTGRVVSQNKTSITIQTDSGRRTILKSQIRRVDYKSPEAVRREEEQRREREAAERRRKEAKAARKAEEERRARLEAERLRQAEEAAREAEARRGQQETAGESSGESALDPGRSLAEFLGDAAYGAGFELHDAAAADFLYDGPTNLAGGNHLFERKMGAWGALAPVFFYEQSIGKPWLVPGIEAGFLYRRDELRPGLLYPALSGWEFFLRPSIGLRIPLSEDFALQFRGLYAFAATQLGRDFYGLEWTLQQGVVLDQLDGIQRYRIRNPQYGGPGLRIAFEFDRFRVWIGRQWLSGKAGDARIYRDNWIVGLGMRL